MLRVRVILPEDEEFEEEEEEAVEEAEEEELEMFDESLTASSTPASAPDVSACTTWRGASEQGWSCTFAHGKQELHPCVHRPQDPPSTPPPPPLPSPTPTTHRTHGQGRKD